MSANEMTFGVEIETTIPAGACQVGPHGAGIQVPWLPEGWKADRDPSIRYRAGRAQCEFVSPVLQGAEGFRQLEAAITEMVRRGARVNSSCGLHVHIGFDSTDSEALDRLVNLVANFEKAIFATTGTKKRETGRWCKGVRRYNDASSARERSNRDRYHVLNTSNLANGRKPTVEFRPFAGSLNPTKVIGYVRMCLALVEKAMNTTRKTKWTAKTPVETSPIHRSGEGQTEVTRLFYTLGWTKGRESYEYGNVEAGATTKEIKKEFMRLARKYDQQG